ncbi:MULTISPECIES: YbeD family protein [Neptunomonas]|uniref:UPF0250 protein EOE65_05185 n=1 Tax=Neptunomonas marina TaxID=1815562 RepID=A0A437QAH3_9GAMM|nr:MULTISPECIES: DUF493 domain-containing protein [Neptunomonas]RVU31383.1 DUF493 domain-containing protein [Neptunomonas marina]
MTNQEPPKIEFPCENYPIKVVGNKSDELHVLVLDIVRKHAPDFDETTVTFQDSSKGSFRSVRFSITATGEAQLKAMHEELIAHDSIKIVI